MLHEGHKASKCVWIFSEEQWKRRAHCAGAAAGAFSQFARCHRARLCAANHACCCITAAFWLGNSGGISPKHCFHGCISFRRLLSLRVAIRLRLEPLKRLFAMWHTLQEKCTRAVICAWKSFWDKQLAVRCWSQGWIGFCMSTTWQ